MSYEAQITSHYADVRARLRGVPRPLPPVALALPTPDEEREVQQVVTAMPPQEIWPVLKGAPLNFLSPCSWRFLVSLASVRSGISQQEITGPARNRNIVAARYEAMSLVYLHTQASLPVVGRLFDRDHTTVLHALRKTGAGAKLVELTPYTQSAARKAPGSKPAAKAKQPRKRTVLQRAVIRAYQHGVSSAVVAEAYGCNPRSVKVIAHKLGLKRPDYTGKSKTDWKVPAPVVEVQGL